MHNTLLLTLFIQMYVARSMYGTNVAYMCTLCPHGLLGNRPPASYLEAMLCNECNQVYIYTYVGTAWKAGLIAYYRFPG